MLLGGGRRVLRVPDTFGVLLAFLVVSDDFEVVGRVGDEAKDRRRVSVRRESAERYLQGAPGRRRVRGS